MMEPLLDIRGLHSNIGQYHILHGVDLQVPAGGLTVLLGAQRCRQEHHPAHHHGVVPDHRRLHSF